MAARDRDEDGEFYRRFTAEVIPFSSSSLKTGGGDGTSGDMERVVKLETLMDVVRTDIAGLKADTRDICERLIRLEEKVAHLPSKGFIVTATTGTLALLTAIVLLQTKIQAFLNIPH